MQDVDRRHVDRGGGFGGLRLGIVAVDDQRVDADPAEEGFQVGMVVMVHPQYPGRPVPRKCHDPAQKADCRKRMRQGRNADVDACWSGLTSHCATSYLYCAAEYTP